MITMRKTVTDPAERMRRWAQLYEIFCRDDEAEAGSEAAKHTDPASAKSQSAAADQQEKVYHND